MDFLNGLGRKLGRAARGVQERTRESVENSRLSSELRAARSELERLYGELGRAYCARLAGGDEVPGSLVERVRVAQARVDEWESRRPPRIQMRCAGCGAIPPDGARYCGACGKRLPEAEPEEAEGCGDDAVYCAVCGAMRQGPSAYCAVCGAAFEGSSESLPSPERKKIEAEPPEEPESFGE